jgi:hypothetical protein
MGDLEPVVIAVELGGSEGARLRWAPRPADDGNGAAPPSPWELEATPDWDRLESLRLVSARFEDGAALGAAALRPRDARGHDEDAVVARLVDAEGEQTAISEALVSMEYDADGAPRRLGIELWMDSDSSPRRVAADRAGEPGRAGDRESVPMRFRLDGVEGAGLYEILHPA